MTVLEVLCPGTGSRLISLVFRVDFPPEFSLKYDNRQSYRPGMSTWSTRDAWYRSVDILYDPNTTRHAPTRLQNTTSTINIGRWTTYRIVFDLDRMDLAVYQQFIDALRDFNIDVKRGAGFHFMSNEIPSVFEFIDPHPESQKEYKSFADELLDNSICHLPFEVRYQLEVCISESFLNEYNLSREFVEQLNGLGAERAKEMLAEVATRKKRIYHPMDIFETTRLRKPKRKAPEYAFTVYTAVVTPTSIYFGTPSVEISNRIVRHYSEYADRFLRVRFTDERHKGNIYGTERQTLNEVFTRVKRTLMNGIVIGDRHYEFLAFGNSQFRENGAYFFCPLPHLSAAKIRKWMGNFEDIKIVAKYAARLGQCFSTTRAIHGARVTIKELEDITSQDGKFTFSDGVGIISKFLAQVAASEIGILTASGDPPSAIQFRLGGCKGVLVVWPLANKRDIYIRKSQHKFDTQHEGLEIIRWSQFSAAHLNRQLIAILTTLGVPDHVFTDKLDKQLLELSVAMEEPQVAVRMLQREIDPNQMTLEIAEMVNNRFQMAREPFMISILYLWRAFSIKYLKEKAKLAVEEGAVLLGCLDESGKLQGHWDHLNDKVQKDHDVASLPEVFIQLSRGPLAGESQVQIVEGVVLLARNPSLHPGDIRVVKAVNVPELHHLKDVVVLPRTGDRDLSGMCSGGDLDGDDYLVIWEKGLIPQEWNHEPMDYTPPPPLTVPHDITVDDITSFFVQYMKNDSLGSIATAHLATADASPKGAKAPNCIELARLHSMAVDYAKSGQPAQMPIKLKPKQWPHFMENRSVKYHSRTALGQLYDRVELVDFVPVYDLSFDARILKAFDIDTSVLEIAANIKGEYDAAVRRIMTQHDIATDFEVWSTFVLHHAKQKKDYKFHEEIGQLSTVLKDTFRNRCCIEAGGRDFEKLAPFVAAMYTVTSRQVSEALKDPDLPKERRGHEFVKRMPLISFPWLFPAILGEVAMGRVKSTGEGMESVVSGGASRGWRKAPQPMSITAGQTSEEDVIQTQDGPKHRGDVLKLFSSDDAEISHAEDVINFGQNPPNEQPAHEKSTQVDNIATDSSRSHDSKDGSDSQGKGEASTPAECKGGNKDTPLADFMDSEEVVASPIPNPPSLLSRLADFDSVDDSA